jgi:hypothetical protein
MTIVWHHIAHDTARVNINQADIIHTFRFIYFKRKLEAEGALSQTISEKVKQ